MRIVPRILAPYVMLVALLIAVGLLSSESTKRVSDRFSAAVDRTQPVLAALQEVRYETLRFVAETELRYHGLVVGAEGPQGTLAREPDLDLRSEELDAAYGNYSGLVAVYFPDEQPYARAIGEIIRLIKQTAESAVADGEPDRATETGNYRRLLALAAVLDNAVGAAIAQERTELAEQRQGIDDLEATGVRTQIAASVVAILIALLLGGMSTSRVARPVIAIRDAARRFGEGQLSARVPPGADGELGELAAAFNGMADTVSRTMVSRDFVENVLESMADGVLVIGRNETVVRCNRAMRGLLRFDEQDLVGLPLSAVVGDVSLIRAAVAAESGVTAVETTLRDVEGGQVTCAISVARLFEGGTHSGAVLVAQDITVRKEHEDRLALLANYDALTGLANRNLFVDHLRQALTRLPWSGKHAAVLFCDLDRFKFVNDTLGHNTGDMLLQRVADRLRDAVRPGDLVARLAGDEFVVLLSEVARADHIGAVAANLSAALTRPYQVGPHELFITASIGISVAPQDGLDGADLLKHADLAMYAAKQEGRNGYRFFSRAMSERSQQRIQVEASLRRALSEGDQLEVHYQAQRSIRGGVLGFEALVRWQHPEHGLLAPARFLPAAEDAGLVANIDEWVLGEACLEAARWRRAGRLGLRVAVNVSNQLFQRGDLAALVALTLARTKLPADWLELELTEAIVMDDVERAIRTMQDVRELGVHLSIDDFGTGFSSLAHLKRCPVQTLKIDRSFVTDVTVDPNDRAITEAIVAIAHKLGIGVLAEGVETEDQLDILDRFGCDSFQGYLLSKPVPARELEALMVRLTAWRPKLTARSRRHDQPGPAEVD